MPSTAIVLPAGSSEKVWLDIVTAGPPAWTVTVPATRPDVPLVNAIPSKV